MALTAQQKQKLDEIKALVKEIRDWKEIYATTTMNNYGNGMFFGRVLPELEKAIEDLGKL